MGRNSSANLEASVGSFRIDIESIEVREAIPNRTNNKILNIGGVAGSSGTKHGTRNYLQTATSSVIEAIQFTPPFESQATVVTGWCE